jgi:serine/threonine-protein kinase HipA
VPGSRQYETFRHLTATLLLTYALRNADCHAKNIALLYTSRADVHLSPAYDFLTTSVYAGYQHNPPGIGFLGKKTWTPGKNLSKFIAGTFGIPAREQSIILESISDSVAETVPLVREKIAEHPDFRDIGKRMLLAWQEGVTGLRTFARSPSTERFGAPQLFKEEGDHQFEHGHTPRPRRAPEQ